LAGVLASPVDHGRLSLGAAGTILAAGSPGGFGEVRVGPRNPADRMPADIPEKAGTIGFPFDDEGRPPCCQDGPTEAQPRIEQESDAVSAVPRRPILRSAEFAPRRDSSCRFGSTTSIL
jgi:hypothetical protein